MATDTTAAPTTTAQDASQAPAAAEATQTQAPAEGTTTATPAPWDFKSLVAGRLGKKTASDAGTPQPVASQAAPAPEATAEKPPIAAAPPVKAEPPAPVVDDIAARLRELHDSNQRAAEQRKASRRMSELEAKARDAEGAHAKEVALAKAIEDARTKRDFVGLLKAAGYTLDEIKNTPLIVDMVDQLGKLDETGGDAEKPKPLTEADLARMLKEREDTAAAERKAKEEAERKEKLAELEQVRSEYFAEVKVHFRAGDYPALKQAGTTQGALDAYRADYVRANPNHRPTPKELLDLAERDLRALWKKNADALAKLEGGTPAPAAPTSAVALAKPQSKRTVTRSMTDGAGAIVPPPVTTERKPYREKEREMKDAFVSRWR